MHMAFHLADAMVFASFDFVQLVPSTIHSVLEIEFVTPMARDSVSAHRVT